MRFSSKEDISAPIDQVFLAVTDFDGFERQGLRRGAEIYRSDPDGAIGKGSEWEVKFRFRGKQREAKAELTSYDPPNGFTSMTSTGGLEGDFVVELVALSPKRTRLNVSLELSARSLAGRLLVQSLKFARANLTKRFDKRVTDFAKTIEDKYGPQT